MRLRALALMGPLLLAACGGAKPRAVDGDRPATTPAREASMDYLTGTWTYAEDPEGVAPYEAFYDGSTMTFREDGGYAFQAAGTSFALEGTWTVRDKSDGEATVDIAYGSGRKTVYHLVPRREGGSVSGILVYEGEARDIPPRWVVPAP